MLKNYCNPIRGTHTDRLAMDEKRSAAEVCEACDTAQQRGFAAARGTDDAHDLVALDRKRQLMKGDDGAVEEQLAGTLGEDRCIHGFVADTHASLIHARSRPSLARRCRQVSGKNLPKANASFLAGHGCATRQAETVRLYCLAESCWSTGPHCCCCSRMKAVTSAGDIGSG